MKKQVIETIKNLVGHEYLYFATSLLMKINPHTYPVHIWAVSVLPDDRIFLMDGLEQWFELEETDRNYELVLATLFQRVKTIEKLKTA